MSVDGASALWADVRSIPEISRTEFVITRYRDSNANLRTQFERIIRRAGLEPWEKLFQNLRSTRETELAEEFPIQVVTAWLGNPEPVARKHYLQVTDAHFAKATQNPTQSGAEIERTTTKRPLRLSEFPADSARFTSVNTNTVAEAGLETSSDFAGNSTIGRQGDSQSDSLGGIVDPRLARLIEVWPVLDDDVKAEIVRLASYDVDDLNDLTTVPVGEAVSR